MGMPGSIQILFFLKLLKYNDKVVSHWLVNAQILMEYILLRELNARSISGYSSIQKCVMCFHIRVSMRMKQTQQNVLISEL